MQRLPSRSQRACWPRRARPARPPRRRWPRRGRRVIGTAAAGKLLTGLSGTWAGFSDIALPLPVVPLQRRRRRVPFGARRDLAELQARRQGRRPDARPDRFATDTTGTTTAYSSLIGPIAPRRPLLEATAQPVVAGPPVQGKMVQATTGTWSPVPTKLSYRWERCNANGRSCAAIPNATGTLVHDHRAPTSATRCSRWCRLRTGRRSRTHSARRPRCRAGTVRGPLATLGPVVGGYAVVGQQLAATPGIWKGVGPVVLHVQVVPLRRERRALRSGSERDLPTATRRPRRTPAGRSR